MSLRRVPPATATPVDPVTGDAAALIDELEGVRDTFTPGAAGAKRRALEALETRPVRRPRDLVRLHEALCFLRAHPDDADVLARVEQALGRVGPRVRALPRSARTTLEGSGIAATEVCCPFSLPVVRWLADRFPGHTEIDWAVADEAPGLGAALALVLPPIEEDAVEAGVPYRRWLTAARDAAEGSDLRWLLDRLAAGGRGGSGVARLVDGLEIPVRWTLDETTGARTHAHLPAWPLALVRGPLRRPHGPLRRHLPGPPVRVERPAPALATQLLDAAMAAVSVRYREVHGFTWASLDDVVVGDVGHGVRIAWFGVRPEHRLPLRAHYGYLLLRNGVPIGYGDASLLLDRAEMAFNVFEAFRRGESAWVYTRLLAFLRQWFGVCEVAIDPYQIGAGNAEAIESGAFWFYDKLGFRSARADLRALARTERRLRAGDPAHRSTRATLERLCEAGMGATLAGRPEAARLAFDVRRLGLRAAARAGAAGAGELVATVARRLGIARRRGWTAAEEAALRRLAPVLALLSDVATWPPRDRRRLVEVVRAKGGRSERDFLLGLRDHRRLGDALLRLGAAL